MAKSKQKSSKSRIDLVREARAGMIPESDNIANEVHVRTNQTARMVRTAKTHLGSVTSVSEELAITNILADLRHYCDGKGLTFRKLYAAASAQYDEDKEYEATWENLPCNP